MQRIVSVPADIAHAVMDLCGQSAALANNIRRRPPNRRLVHLMQLGHQIIQLADGAANISHLDIFSSTDHSSAECLRAMRRNPVIRDAIAACIKLHKTERDAKFKNQCWKSMRMVLALHEFPGIYLWRWPGGVMKMTIHISMICDLLRSDSSLKEQVNTPCGTLVDHLREAGLLSAIPSDLLIHLMDPMGATTPEQHSYMNEDDTSDSDDKGFIASTAFLETSETPSLLMDGSLSWPEYGTWLGDDGV